MRLRKWMAVVMMLVFLGGLLPAGMAMAEEEAMLPRNQVLVKGKVVFNDAALQKAIENAPFYGWYASPKEFLENTAFLDLTATDSPISDLSVLQLCGKLEVLLLTSDQLKSLEPLVYCKKLEQLALMDCNPVDLTPLKRCKGLTAIRLQGSGITSLDVVAQMKKLKIFAGNDLKNVDYSPLAAVLSLTEVQFTNCTGDITPLATLKKLDAITVTAGDLAGLDAVLQGAAKKLVFAHLDKVKMTDALLTSIAACGKLQTLRLLNTAGTVSLTSLAGCKSLKTLLIDTLDTLAGTQGLATLPKLSDVSFLRVRNAAFAGLDTLPAVTSLTLYAVQADDLGFITRLPKLTELTLGALRGTDYAFLDGLASAGKLKALSLYGVPLTQLSMAAKLTGLNVLHLQDTGITDISALSKLKKLKYVTLYYNPITDYRPLRALNGCTLQLGDNLNERIILDLQTANPKSFAQAESADVDPLYDEAVFFGDANPQKRGEREDTTAQANKAALAALDAEAQEKAEAVLLKSLKKAKVAGKNDLFYYTNKGGITIEGIFAKFDVVRLPDMLDNLPVTTLVLEERNTDGFDGIQTLIIPASVTRIDKLDMRTIKAFFVDADNPAFCSQNGVLLSHDGKTLVRYPFTDSSHSTYSVPDGVENIAVDAFSGYADYHNDLTVVLPASVSRFDMEAANDEPYNIERGVYAHRFEVSPDNALFASVEGTLTDKQGEVLIAMGRCTGVDADGDDNYIYTIPEGITTIGANVDIRAGNQYDSLSLPASLVSIEGINTTAGWNFGNYDVAQGNTVFATRNGNLVSVDGKTLYKAAVKTTEIPQWHSEAVIPDGVQTVPLGALPRSCHVTIPASVTSISVAHLDYANVKSFAVEADNAVYSSRDGVLFSKDGKTLICYPSGAEAVDTYTVPAGVEIIGESAFTLNADAQKIVLPDTVRELRPNAVQDWNLKEITVPASVTVIGDYALPLYAHIISPEGSATWMHIQKRVEMINARGGTIKVNITSE